MGLRKIPQKEKISPQFREKIMLAVSAVNSCTYCSYLHARVALEQGISHKEIDDIIENDMEHFTPFEVPGILFAQHFSETKGNVSKDALKKLVESYGEYKALQIQAFIQSVFFGNLCCNTVVSFKKGLLTQEEKKGLRLTYLFSLPIARMIRKKSGAEE